MQPVLVLGRRVEGDRGTCHPCSGPELGDPGPSAVTSPGILLNRITAAAWQTRPGGIGLPSALKPSGCSPSPSPQPQGGGSCLRQGAVWGALGPPQLPQGPTALRSEVSQGEEEHLFIVPTPCHILTSNL